MKRAILSATVVACTFSLTVSARSGAAERKTPVSHDSRAIAIEVLIVGTKGGTRDEHAVQLSGPSDEVAARVRELESKGQIVVIDRIRLTTLENQTTLVQAGRATPVASGRSSSGRDAPAQMSYHHEDLGTLISATARVDGDAVVVELEVEKSELERNPGKPQADDEFVPLGTETFTARVTVRIGSGKTVLASGLETRAGTDSSGQLVLASALLLDTADRTEKRQIRIFSLQDTSAEDAAAVVKELCDDGLGQIKVVIDSRTNSLIVSGEKERQLDVVEAILLRLDQTETRRAPQASKDEEKSDSTPLANKYDKMEKNDLEEELKRLQKEVLVAERIAKKAREKTTKAKMAYQSASDDGKGDALLRKIEADAAGRKPTERFTQIRSDFDAAERAYFRLLVAE